MVVERQRREIGQRLAREGDGQEAGAEAFDARDVEFAQFEFMAYALDDGLGHRCLQIS